MPNFSKSVLSYADVHQVFEQAGKLGSVTLTFDTVRKATTWVSRANAYRVLLRKNNVALGRPFTSEFDHLMVRRKLDSNVVKVEPRGFDFASAVGPDGKTLELSSSTLSGPVPLPHEAAKQEEEIENFLKDYEKDVKK